MSDRIETNQKDLSINCDVRRLDGHRFHAPAAGKLFPRSAHCPASWLSCALEQLPGLPGLSSSRLSVCSAPPSPERGGSPLEKVETSSVEMTPKEKEMGLFSKDIKTLEELFVHGLKAMYYAENQILKALPRLIEHVTNPRLKKGLKDHLKETAEQVSRLDQIFEMRQQRPKGTRCSGINGLITEGEDLLGQVGDKAILDAAIITSAQAVEHYEITRYGALIAWAQKIGRGDFAAILQKNLDEETAADKRLSAIAEGRVNSKAVGHARSRRASKQSSSRKPAAGRRKAA